MSLTRKKELRGKITTSALALRHLKYSQDPAVKVSRRHVAMGTRAWKRSPCWRIWSYLPRTIGASEG